MGGSAMGWMSVLWPIFVAAGLFAIVYIGYRLIAPRDAEDLAAGETRTAARRILDERFARGELSEKEYRRRRSEIDR